jgi:hypothetical protein
LHGPGVRSLSSERPGHLEDVRIGCSSCRQCNKGVPKTPAYTDASGREDVCVEGGSQRNAGVDKMVLVVWSEPHRRLALCAWSMT